MDSSEQLPSLCRPLRIKTLIADLILSGVLLVIATACSRGSVPYVAPPASLENPPTYSAAQQVQITPIAFNKVPTKFVTFYTADTPDTVLNFYREAFIKDRWALDASNKSSTEQRFSISGGCPIYEMVVTVVPVSGGMNKVELRPRVEICID